MGVTECVQRAMQKNLIFTPLMPHREMCQILYKIPCNMQGSSFTHARRKECEKESRRAGEEERRRKVEERRRGGEEKRRRGEEVESRRAGNEERRRGEEELRKGGEVEGRRGEGKRRRE